MQGLRKIGRTLGIVALTVAGCVVLSDAFRADAEGLQILIGVALLLGAFGLVATWFFPTS